MSGEVREDICRYGYEKVQKASGRDDNTYSVDPLECDTGVIHIV
jgi:hypothetical protein